MTTPDRPWISSWLPFWLRPGIDTTGKETDAIVLVPGFGCDREWMRGAYYAEALRDAALISFNLPGQGTLASDATGALWDGELEYLTQWIEAVLLLATNTGDRFHIVAHSMGTIPALAAWESLPEHRRGAFISIEGNISIEDCFATRRLERSVEEVDAFSSELLMSDDEALTRWGSDLKFCNSEHLRKLARNVVEACSTADVTTSWCFLEDAHYLYGAHSGYPEHHRKLFEETGTVVHEIPDSGHFPMHDNPKATWNAVADAVRSTRA